MAHAAASSHDRVMALSLSTARPLPRRPVRARPSIAAADVALWLAFAVAAAVFVLDATTTIAVVALRPDAVEQNPIARWTLTAHPIAPYLLKAAVIAECAVACALARSMGERWAAWVMVALMAGIGTVGIVTALRALAA
jgi:hypothetical protein